VLCCAVARGCCDAAVAVDAAAAVAVLLLSYVSLLQYGGESSSHIPQMQKRDKMR